MSENPPTSEHTEAVEPECCGPNPRPTGLVHNCSCSSAAYFDEGAMERAMRRHAEVKSRASD